jgi:hypothetical protein
VGLISWHSSRNQGGDADGANAETRRIGHDLTSPAGGSFADVFFSNAIAGTTWCWQAKAACD